jgi:integrase
MRRRFSTPRNGSAGINRPTLADVEAALENNRALSAIRRRDLRSAVRRVAHFMGADPSQIPLELGAISQKFAGSIAIAGARKPKTVVNLRSDFMAAVRASGIMPIHPARHPLSSEWQKLLSAASSMRTQIGLSRFARWCSSSGIEPTQVSDAVLGNFMEAVRQSTLHRRPNALHRNVTLIWNAIAQKGDFALQLLSVPSFRAPVRRIDWSLLPQPLRNELDHYCDWCSGDNPFAVNARSRPLAPRTINLQRNHIRAAVTALVESGISPDTVTSLRDLLTIDNFKRILRRRHEMVGGGENVFNRDLARTLIEIARRWVKVDAPVLDELKRLVSKIPVPLPGLTSKNKARLRQFDDPENLRRLIEFPDRLWAEVKRDKKPNFRTVLKAQAALAIGLPSFMPIRPQNLWALEFDKHIFLHEGWGATSTLELPGAEVKNRVEAAFDIPYHLAKMLIEYRNRLVPKVIGRRPDRLFIKADGSAKNQWAVAWLIRTVLRRRLGLQFSGHAFRHLSAKTILDREPGNFETVRQLLGHKSLHTTVSAYVGLSTRRAARHHQNLLEQALSSPKPVRGRRTSGRDNKRGIDETQG